MFVVYLCSLSETLFKQNPLSAAKRRAQAAIECQEQIVDSSASHTNAFNDVPNASSSASFATDDTQNTCSEDEFKDLTQFLEGMFPELNEEAASPVPTDLPPLVRASFYADLFLWYMSNDLCMIS